MMNIIITLHSSLLYLSSHPISSFLFFRPFLSILLFHFSFSLSSLFHFSFSLSSLFHFSLFLFLFFPLFPFFFFFSFFFLGLAMSASKSKLLSLAEFPTGILYHHDLGTYVRVFIFLVYIRGTLYNDEVQIQKYNKYFLILLNNFVSFHIFFCHLLIL